MNLKKKLSKQMTLASATTRLIKIILRMSPEEIMMTLEKFEANSFPTMRNEPREDYFGEVVYSAKDQAVSSYINNISNGGMFIETHENLTPGQDITLTYSMPETHEPVKVEGIVTRVAAGGVGVAFKTDARAALRRKKMINRIFKGPGVIS